MRDNPQRLLSGIFEGEVSLARKLHLYGVCYANPARFCQRFEACGDVHAIAEQVVTLHHNVTEINAI